MTTESRFGSVRKREWLAAGLALAVFAYLTIQWGLEAVIHGRKTETVPDLKGRSVPAALDMLAPLNLGLRRESTEFDSSVPISSVLRQAPPAGTVVRQGKIVRVVVSQGGETVLTPAVLGLPLRNAEMLLRQSQLALGEVSDAYSLKEEKGIVLSQDPKPEASVERNALVNVAVSAGPPPAGVVLMPDLLRKNVSDAYDWARGAGAAVSVSTDATSLFPYGVILTQLPEPDVVLPSAAVVSVTISGRRGKGTEEAQAARTTFRYELSQGGSESLVRIVVVDKYGERELFNGLRKPGSKIDIPMQETGGARVKIYLNGILIEERDL